jgi:DNA adenine methylase
VYVSWMTEATKIVATPVIKWAGGKRRLLDEILARTPNEIDTFYEPFCGGAALFFALSARKRFKKAVLNDLNKELVDAYQVIQGDSVRDLIALLKTYPHNRDFYNHIRMVTADQLDSPTIRAARFLYLNRTSYNGLYRVNKKGEFNAPFGKYVNPRICDPELLMRAHEAFQGVTLTSVDFMECVRGAKPGDFVYFDPPYLPISETSNFTSYTSRGFGFHDHQRLAAAMSTLRDNGVAGLLSNSDAPAIRTLFDGFQVDSVSAPRSINSKGDRRGNVGELLISC